MRTTWLLLGVAFASGLAVLPRETCAAPKTPDPDAKGTVSITNVNINLTGIGLGGQVTPTNPWTVNWVRGYAMRQTGGRIYESAATVAGAQAPFTWACNFVAMPNDTYTVWTITEFKLVQQGQPDQFQLVGSALDSAVVNAQNNPNNPINSGSISYGQGSPARANGNAAIVGSGTCVAQGGYKVSPGTGTATVEMMTIPVDGGVVRLGYPASITGNPPAVWTNATVSLPAALKYNVLAWVGISPDPNANPVPNDSWHRVGTTWVKDK